jgi:rRNA-processing protein FCF1
LVVSKENGLKVIIDANFFFLPAKFKVDIFEELADLLIQRFEPILLSSTKKELEGLVESIPKTRKEALLALRFAKKCNLVPVDKDLRESYDDVIVRVASEWKCPVATNDRDLRKRLRKKKISVIFLRQKGRLEIDGAV